MIPELSRMQARVVVRWVLLAMAVTAGVGILATGSHQESWSTLRAGLRDGSISQVQVAGGLPSGATGRASVRVSWHQGLIDRQVTLVEASCRSPRGELGTCPTSGSTSSTGSSESAAAPTLRDVRAALTTLAPGVRLTEASTPWWRGDGPRFTLAGAWDSAAWAGLLGLVALLGTLGHLVGGPPPARATKWGWFWIIWAVPPLGLVAYLLLAEPMRPLPLPPKDGARLTGGWSFLGALLFGGAASAGATALLIGVG